MTTTVPTKPVYKRPESVSTGCGDAMQGPDAAVLLATPSGIARLFADYSTRNVIFGKDVVAWSQPQLRNLIEDSDVTDIYYVIGSYSLPSDAAALIQVLISKGVRVFVKRVTAALVATDGQYNYQSVIRHADDTGWHFMLAADNHDLYTTHATDNEANTRTILFFPRHAPAKTGLTLAQSNLMNEDSKSYSRFLTAVAHYRANCELLGLPAEAFDINLSPVRIAGA